jgi:hypothetical protein
LRRRWGRRGGGRAPAYPWSSYSMPQHRAGEAAVAGGGGAALRSWGSCRVGASGVCVGRTPWPFGAMVSDSRKEKVHSTTLIYRHCLGFNL